MRDVEGYFWKHNGGMGLIQMPPARNMEIVSSCADIIKLYTPSPGSTMMEALCTELSKLSFLFWEIRWGSHHRDSNLGHLLSEGEC